MTDFGWGVIAPLLPNEPRGVVRVDDRSILNSTCSMSETGVPAALADGARAVDNMLQPLRGAAQS
jgi:hypothetical protein